MLRVRIHISDEAASWLLAIAAIVIFLSWYFSRTMVIKRKLNNTSARPIHEYMDGESGKINARVVIHRKPKSAPLSGRKCAYYYIKVEATSGKRVHTLIEEETKNTVLVKEGNHYALISTSVIKSHIVTDMEYSSGLWNDATPELKRYLRKHGENSEDSFGFNRSIRYYEDVLEDGEMIAVTGCMKWKNTGELRLKLPVSRVLCVEGNYEEPVYLSDDPDVTQSA